MEYKDPKIGKTLKIPLGRNLSEFTYDWDREAWIDNKTGEIVQDNLIEFKFPPEEIE